MYFLKGCLMALGLDDRRTDFFVLLFRNPELMEGAERCKDRSTKPAAALALGLIACGMYLDLALLFGLEKPGKKTNHHIELRTLTPGASMGSS